MKLMRSDKFTVTSMYGIDNESEGMKRARKNGLKTFGNGIDGIYDLDESERPQILFDATSAGAHEHNNKVAQELGIRMIDLTPAAVGPFVSPSVNLDEFIEETNVNMITCGGQATAPIVAAISDVVPVKYAEIVDGKFDEEEVVASIREREKRFNPMCRVTACSKTPSSTATPSRFLYKLKEQATSCQSTQETWTS